MASVGFEPANLSTKGQHATSRPPKALSTEVIEQKYFLVLYVSVRATRLEISLTLRDNTLRDSCLTRDFFFPLPI
jgi:hypothetical protein